METASPKILISAIIRVKYAKSLFGTVVLLLWSPLIGCQSPPLKPEKIVHGLSENELNYLGDRLGYKVENLGMSDYRFTRGSTTFGVTAHNDLGTRQTLADEPVTLGYSLPGAKRPLEMQIPVAQGITLKVLETDFRGFIQKIEVTQKRG